MKRLVDVHTGEIMAGSNETILHSDSHNRCMVICAYDSTKKIGGLAHAMFLSGRLNHNNHTSTVLKDAGGAIDEMIDDMLLLGANRENIEVCLMTGENVPHRKDDPDYNKTLQAAVNILKEKHIKYREGTVADVGQLHVSFDVETGHISYD
jgi:chemotaxis receptor (MCP) glutamine deamidase CheD